MPTEATGLFVVFSQGKPHLAIFFSPSNCETALTRTMVITRLGDHVQLTGGMVTANLSKRSNCKCNCLRSTRTSVIRFLTKDSEPMPGEPMDERRRNAKMIRRLCTLLRLEGTQCKLKPTHFFLPLC